jgi:hypothetical protein
MQLSSQGRAISRSRVTSRLAITVRISPEGRKILGIEDPAPTD